MEHKRYYIYDVLRSLSLFFIIAIHCSERLLICNRYDFVWWEHNIINAIVRPGLLLFVFISGALILNKTTESTKTFYTKRFFKVIIPFLICSYLYLWIDKYNLDLKIFLPSNFFTCFLDILSAPVAYHLWFIYMIVGLYVFTPYLRKMLQTLTDNECRNLFILLYLISFIKYFLNSFGIKIGISNLLIVDWSIPYVLGFLLTKDSINKFYKLFYILGFFSFVFLILANRYFPYINNLYDLAPTMLMESSAIFLFFLKNASKICESNLFNKMFEKIATYSYEIYLIHAKILDILLTNFFNRVYIISPFYTTLFAIILTFLISFICVFIINFIIKHLTNYFLHKKHAF